MNKEAFEIIYEENAEKVYCVAKRFSGDHHAAEEITQTVFLTLYKHMDNINEKAVGSWLMTTTKHMALNSQRLWDHEVLVEDVLYCGKEDAAEHGSPEEDFIRKVCDAKYKELADDIFAELYRVNPRWYEALTITYFLEKPQKEVAEIMGIKVEVLHSMLYRAKKWIKKRYEKQFEHLQEE